MIYYIQFHISKLMAAYKTLSALSGYIWNLGTELGGSDCHLFL